MKTPTAGISYIITAVWVVSFVVDIFKSEYDPPVSIHPLMMLVAGALLGEGVIRRSDTKADSEQKEAGGT